MKGIVFSLLLIIACARAMGQGYYSRVLAEIEANSTTLSALRERAEAQKLGNRTGIFMPNPDLEFVYMWGSSAEAGNSTNVSISQSFDFPSVYSYRNRVAGLENENVELAYRAERIDLLLSAKQACIELVYYNALIREYEVRLRTAERIASAYKTKLDIGETTALENNKAQLNVTSVRNSLASAHTARRALLAELERMNGGRELSFETDPYGDSQLPGSFEDWYAHAEELSPVLRYARGRVGVGEANVRLNRAQSLPKFTVGYIADYSGGDASARGAKLGVSIPLWESRNTVKQARAQLKADESIYEDACIQFRNRLKMLYDKAADYRRVALDYRLALSSYDNQPLLTKALEEGEISLLDYLLETEYYYQTVDSALAAEKNYEQSLAELSAVEL